MRKCEIQVVTVVSSPFEENTFITHIDGFADCLVVDPGMEPQKIIKKLQSKRLNPVAILNTHGHSDHIAGNGALKEIWPDCPILIGAGDAPKLTDPILNLSGPYGFALTSPAADRKLHDNEKLSLAGLDILVRTVPGHTVGHVVFIVESCDPLQVFAGDVIFAGAIGRSDFPGGNHDQLVENIHQKLLTLPDETILHSGHGPSTTVGRERRTNPFLR